MNLYGGFTIETLVLATSSALEIRGIVNPPNDLILLRVVNQ
ncbi:7074_t:CDS:2 [Entrophospora sp. SA101]|nr:7074_t:CDS:2 [Entrophospora sp. SA101]CAJ0842803.1 4250_t:CDS:2 [Entrophospora sp. SA101]